jgi:hypothetical protein
MTNTYHTQVLLQADLSNKLENLKRQASTQRLLLEVPRTPGNGSQTWKAFRQAVVGDWQLEFSTGSSTKANT